MIVKNYSRLLNKLKYFDLKIFQRCYSQIPKEQNSADFNSTMSAWQITAYGDEKNLHFLEKVDVPIINSPNEVLIKVFAASVNPLDVEMMSGFGSVLLKNMRQINSLLEKESVETTELPLVLGRDFAGVIVGKGCSVNEFELGDEVYGVVNPQNQGCHAEYAVTLDSLLAKKPEFISMEQASAILYATLTAWGALKISGNFIVTCPRNKRVLVLGGSGGVGNAAIQLLNAWNAQVITTCRTDAVLLVEKLSPEIIIDYSLPNYESKIKSAGPYDIILDAAGLGEERLKQYVPFVNSCGSIITLKSPLLANIDSYGLFGGSIKSVFDLALPNITSGILKKGCLIKWGFFIPSGIAVKEISNFVNEKKIIPAIEKIYSFSEVPEAYARIKAAHLRGKIVISMS